MAGQVQLCRYVSAKFYIIYCAWWHLSIVQHLIIAIASVDTTIQRKWGLYWTRGNSDKQKEQRTQKKIFLWVKQRYCSGRNVSLDDTGSPATCRAAVIHPHHVNVSVPKMSTSTLEETFTLAGRVSRANWFINVRKLKQNRTENTASGYEYTSMKQLRHKRINDWGILFEGWLCPIYHGCCVPGFKLESNGNGQLGGLLRGKHFWCKIGAS